MTSKRTSCIVIVTAKKEWNGEHNDDKDAKQSCKPNGEQNGKRSGKGIGIKPSKMGNKNTSKMANKMTSKGQTIWRANGKQEPKQNNKLNHEQMESNTVSKLTRKMAVVMSSRILWSRFHSLAHFVCVNFLTFLLGPTADARWCDDDHWIIVSLSILWRGMTLQR